MRKSLSKALALCVTVSALAAPFGALAASPSQYDGQPYANLGYESSDPDGEFNLAVIANGDVKIVGNAMYIKGSVYSNGKIYVSNGDGNKVDGLFISKTGDTLFKSNGTDDEWTQYRTAEGYIHVNNDMTTDGINYYSTSPKIAGAVLDNETSFACEYTPYTVPEISNELKADNWSGVDVELNVYGQDQSQWGGTVNTTARTVSQDTKMGKVLMNGAYGPALTIDTTNGPVNVVIDEIVSSSTVPNIKVVGNNDANIYINKLSKGEFFVNYDNTKWPAEISGSMNNTHLYIGGGNIDLGAARIACADINVNADTFAVTGSSKVTGNIMSNAKKFTITGGETEVTGTVCVPYADSEVVGSGTLYGQLHTNTLTNNGTGRIIWKADAAVAKAEVTPAPTTEPTVEPTAEPTPAPTAEPTAEPTPAVTAEPKSPELIPSNDIPAGPKKVLRSDAAYLYGYTDDWVAADRPVTREEASALVNRLLIQNNARDNYVKPEEQSYADLNTNAWSYSALEYMTFIEVYNNDDGSGDKRNISPSTPATRGEVAKIVAFSLRLPYVEGTMDFDDITPDHKFYKYIKALVDEGLLRGSDGGINPDGYMTRAEFVTMFNRIIGRTEENGYIVTQEDCPFIFNNDDTELFLPAGTKDEDGNEIGHWAYYEITRAACSFTNKKVDPEKKLDRGWLDQQ